MFRVGMFIGSIVVFGLAFWILEAGPQLTGWKSEWTRELQFTFAGLWLMSLLTVGPVSNFVVAKNKMRGGFYKWTMALLAWSLVLTIGYGLVRIITARVLGQPLEDDFISLGSLTGAYLAILVFVVAPLIFSGVFFCKVIQIIGKLRATRGA